MSMDEKEEIKNWGPSEIAVAAAKADTSDRIYRVYCDGVFDIFHLGHMRMLEQAKKMLGAHRTHLIIGVHSDEVVNKFKGRTVMDERNRYDSVAHCKWVDEVHEDAPWVITEELLERHNIDFVAHDALPYTDTSGDSPSGDLYSHIKTIGKFLETKRTEGVSTSDIIVKIVRDYDKYVERNLARGYTRQDLNVGRTWEFRAQSHRKTEQIKARYEDTKREFQEYKDAIRNFLGEFDPRDGKLFVRTEEGNHVAIAPGKYIRNIIGGVVENSGDVIYHGIGLARALVGTGFAVVSWINPFSYIKYCCPKKKRTE